MAASFPEIKSKNSLVAKYVTEDVWKKLASEETKTSKFTLAKAHWAKIRGQKDINSQIVEKGQNFTRKRLVQSSVTL